MKIISYLCLFGICFFLTLLIIQKRLNKIINNQSNNSNLILYLIDSFLTNKTLEDSFRKIILKQNCKCSLSTKCDICAILDIISNDKGKHDWKSLFYKLIDCLYKSRTKYDNDNKSELIKILH